MFTTAANELLDDLVRLRRDLHSEPEIGLDLPRSQAKILAALDGLDLDITLGKSLSSVTAVLRGALPGPTVLLRADMDGLPVREATGLEFAAGNGAMHACGHDLHQAGLVGAARLLHSRQAELAGSIVLMFQPGEEGYAGAKMMLDEGVLEASGDRPVAAYAIHVDCMTPLGQFVTRPGAIMASASALKLRVVGTGGHAAAPHLSIDPIPVAAEIVLAVQSFVARRVPATDPAVVSVVRLVSDSLASNVLATSVEIEANIRTLSRETLVLVRTELVTLAERIAGAHGCTVAAEFISSYPVCYNDEVETAGVLALLDEQYGTGRVVRLPSPSMASEDFAYVLDEVPGTLLFLGAMPTDVAGTPPGMHSDRAAFDDSILAVQAATLAELAWTRLHHDD
jgi:amidohydrolase